MSDWLAGLDGTDYSELKKDFTPESMYKWMRENPGHRFFTVVRHPVVRAHAAFCDKILSTGKGSYLEIRKTLIESYGLVLPDKTPCDTFDIAAHKAAFMAFLRFVELNLAGQTSIRIDPHWASQSNTIQGFAQFRAPDAIIREDGLEDQLAHLAAQIGRETMPEVRQPSDPHQEKLHQIYDEGVEAAVRNLYERDYVAFGFGPYV